MVLLALDTTTRAGSCAVAVDGRVVREAVSDPGRDHAEQLPGAIAALLGSAGLTLDAVDVLAVAIGPGSFTGLRIGIASMQGLALATARPLIGVSALDALAAIGGSTAQDPPGERVGQVAQSRLPRIATWMDAWRGEVYAALYEDGHEVAPPAVAHPELLLAGLAGKATIFIGDGVAAYADLIRQRMGAAAHVADPVAPLLAGAIARLATDRARAGELPPPDAIRPLYVRRPDAERARTAGGTVS